MNTAPCGYELRTGCQPIDDDHWEVVTLLTHFVSEINKRSGKKAACDGDLSKLMAQVAQRVVQHFSLEESWMDRISFAQSREHREAHVIFIRDVEKYQLRLGKEGPSKDIQHWANTRLVPWFCLHTKRHDIGLSRAILDAQDRATRNTATS